MDLDDRNVEPRVAKGFRPRCDVLIGGVDKRPVEVKKQCFHQLEDTRF
jgi:hypothetical protein